MPPTCSDPSPGAACAACAVTHLPRSTGRQTYWRLHAPVGRARRPALNTQCHLQGHGCWTSHAEVQASPHAPLPPHTRPPLHHSVRRARRCLMLLQPQPGQLGQRAVAQAGPATHPNRARQAGKACCKLIVASIASISVKVSHPGAAIDSGAQVLWSWLLHAPCGKALPDAQLCCPHAAWQPPAQHRS